MAHVGISLGNGYVVDARGHAVGVIKSKLTAYPWTHMAFPRGFPLPDSLMKTGGEPSAPAQPAPSRPAIDLHALHLAPGDRGESVRLVQTQLTRLGYPLPRFGIDGIYGSETACAVVAFQKVAGLVSSGAADEDTMKALFPRPDPIQAAEASLDDEEHAYSFTL
ncbi:MAG: peptidoglycan-binding protein [Clostridiales bacterium]|nr:peptidoglycan-binding protein [Clostridiales bacterium]